MVKTENEILVCSISSCLGVGAKMRRVFFIIALFCPTIPLFLSSAQDGHQPLGHLERGLVLRVDEGDALGVQ